MEHYLTDLQLKLREIHSYIFVLQQALQNSTEEVSLENIDDSPEIIIRQIENIQTEHDKYLENV